MAGEQLGEESNWGMPWKLLLYLMLLVRRSGAFRRRQCGCQRAHINAEANPDYSYHVPVLKSECLEYLRIRANGVYVDCTLGGGGHTRAILEAGGRVIGFDQDPDAVAKATSICQKYIDEGKLEIFQSNFRSFADLVMTKSALAQERGGNRGPGLGRVDGVLMDLGVSSHQINEPTRGFAFGADGPLDMRMSKGGLASLGPLTAGTIVNEYDTETLANILYDFGEETRSRQIAREIVSARPLASTGQLEKVISRITSYAQRPKVLARCFQALRIAVNDEMGVLDEALLSAHKCLLPRGRLVVISYHSLEDRRVKRVMKTGSPFLDGGDDGGGGRSGSLFFATPPQPSSTTSAHTLASVPWSPLFKRAQAPTDAEIELNRRARSAKLRVAERVEVQGEEEHLLSAAWTEDADQQLPKQPDAPKGPFIGKKQQLKLERQRKLAAEQRQDDE